MKLKEPFNFYIKVYFEIVYIARLVLYVQHIGQSSNMKKVSFFTNLCGHITMDTNENNNTIWPKIYQLVVDLSHS